MTAETIIIPELPSMEGLSGPADWSRYYSGHAAWHEAWAEFYKNRAEQVYADYGEEKPADHHAGDFGALESGELKP